MKPRNLDRRQDTTDDQRSRDQILGDLGVEVGAAGDDDGRSDDTSQHGECVLKSEEEREENGHAILETEEGSALLGFLHEWQVGPEEKCWAR